MPKRATDPEQPLPTTAETDGPAEAVLAASLKLAASYPRLATLRVYDADTLAEAVCALRHLVGLPQHVVADAMGAVCGHEAAAKWPAIERGQASLDERELGALCAIFRLPHHVEDELRHLPMVRDLSELRRSVLAALKDDDTLLQVAEFLEIG